MLPFIAQTMFLPAASAEELIVVVDDKEPPSLEFLDYLGAMVDTDGELVGPEHFEETRFDDDETDSARDTWVSREVSSEK